MPDTTFSFSEDKILATVRKLIEKAEHPSTDPNEASALRQRADAMMLKHALDAAMFRDAQPAAARAKPGKIRLRIHEARNPIAQYLYMLTAQVAEHCRCLVVYYGMDRRFTCDAEVYGMESDLQYFQMLFTVVQLHLANALAPKVDPSKSKEENVYYLHGNGLNWLDIARLYGWDGNQETAMRDGSAIKRIYQRYCRDRGLDYVKTGNRVSWMKSFAQAYVLRIDQRLREARSNRAAGSALVLRNSSADVRSAMEEDNPDLKMRSIRADQHQFNPDAYRAGHTAAETADISGRSHMANAETRGLEGGSS